MIVQSRRVVDQWILDSRHTESEKHLRSEFFIILHLKEWSNYIVAPLASRASCLGGVAGINSLSFRNKIA